MTEPQEPRGAAPAHLTSEGRSECAFSPETAAEGLLEHVQGCADCAAEVADLRALLAELAALPEPELPESVAIRMDAAVERAWLEVDAEQEAAAEAGSAAANARRSRRPSWRKIAIPLGSLSLIALAAVGAGVALDHSSSGSSASSSSGVSAESAPQSYGSLTDPNVVTWVHSILAGGTTSGPMLSPKVEGVHCADPSVPQRSGYTVLTTSQREFENQPATLVVYQNTREPASPTVLAVVYAGSCASSASDVLAEGSVSR